MISVRSTWSCCTFVALSRSNAVILLLHASLLPTHTHIHSRTHSHVCTHHILRHIHAWCRICIFAARLCSTVTIPFGYFRCHRSHPCTDIVATDRDKLQREGRRKKLFTHAHKMWNNKKFTLRFCVHTRLARFQSRYAMADTEDNAAMPACQHATSTQRFIYYFWAIFLYCFPYYSDVRSCSGTSNCTCVVHRLLQWRMIRRSTWNVNFIECFECAKILFVASCFSFNLCEFGFVSSLPSHWIH